MLVVRTPECRADSLGQFVGTEHSIGLYNLALAVDPLGLYRIEPRALFGQQTAYDPHPASALFDLTVVSSDPTSHLATYVPAGVVPDQHPNSLAGRFELLRAPRKEASSYPAHRAPINKAQPHLIELRQVEPVAGDGFVGSGSSFSTDCAPPGAEALPSHSSYAARAKPACSTKSRHTNPPPRRCRDARPPSSSTGRAAFFSLVLRIWGSDPAFGPLPAHSQPPKRCPDGLARNPLFGEPFFEADLGSHLQSPKATLFAEFARVLVEQLAQSLRACSESKAL
jgi:hypothetical protein